MMACSRGRQVVLCREPAVRRPSSSSRYDADGGRRWRRRVCRIEGRIEGRIELLLMLLLLLLLLLLGYTCQFHRMMAQSQSADFAINLHEDDMSFERVE